MVGHYCPARSESAITMLAKHTVPATMISVAISSPAVTLILVLLYLLGSEIGICSKALCPFDTTFCAPLLILDVSQGRIGPLDPSASYLVGSDEEHRFGRNSFARDQLSVALL